MEHQHIEVEHASKYKQLLKKRYLIGGIVAFLVGFYIVAFSVPKHLDFSYAQDTCTSYPTFFPAIHKVSESGYDTSYKNVTKLGSIDIFSSEICFKPTQAPMKGEVAAVVAPWGGWIARKQFTISVPEMPVLDMRQLSDPIAITKPLKLSLSSPDVIHSYQVAVGDRHTPCGNDATSSTLHCDISTLKLKQKSSYALSVVRSFEGDSSKTYETTIKTLGAVTIKKASVKNDQTIYSKLKSITISASKSVVDLDGLTLRDAVGNDVAVTKELKGNDITIAPVRDLERDMKYTLSIAKIEAVDGSILDSPYALHFSISGGPRVVRSSVGTYDVGRSATVYLTFDQEIATKGVNDYVRLTGGKATVRRVSPTVIAVQLQTMPLCQKFSIAVSKGLTSKYGVVSKRSWTLNSRVICYTTAVYGYSVEGRPLVAYYFGRGSKTFLFTGATHGNELSSNYIMKSWIDELKRNPDSIPSNVRVVVAPAVNPDGVARVKRDNMHNVNLNRNFKTSNWEPDITTGSGTVQKGGGGKAPLSEPESKGLYNLTLSVRPYFVMTYHSKGSLVNNNSSNSSSVDTILGKKYANMVGYRFIPDAATASTFGYPITGSYERWLKELGWPAVTIELSGDTGNYFYNHRSAMWAMIGS